VSASFAACLEATAARVPGRPALLWDGGALTHAALDLRAGGVAAVLAERGLRPGDRVALALPNGPDFVIALLGALKAGATVAPLDPLLTPDERDAVVADLAPALVLSAVPETAGQPWPARAPGGPALVLYTSGSTGAPKGAVLSHEALGFANASWAGPLLGLTPDDVVLGALPLAHSFGLNGALLAPLLAGASVAVLTRFAPEPALAAVARHRVTVLPGVATMFRRLLDAPAMATADLGRLRLAVAGAAPCPFALAEEWRARTGVRLVRGYGMTELFRPVSYLAADTEDRPESVGRAVPGVELRTVDEDGRPLGPDTVGELLIRTPAALDGYLGAAEETGAALRDGWFHTGDLAAISADGFVRIAGRKRERILRGGHSVFPAEVEAVLLAHPAVAEAAVVGRPHDDLGEEVVAYVALQPGAAVAPAALVEHARARLAAFKYPREIVIRDALPRSATGKILKSLLR
jgi:acyl-CoA synthetase (AMP-forming)/AMP-acid ligase II